MPSTPFLLHRLKAGLCRTAAFAALACGVATAQPPAPVGPPASVSVPAPASAPASTDCPPPARAPTAEEAEAGLRNAVDRGFLWKLHRDGRTSVLYGTLHAARPEWAFPGPRVRQALASSDVIAFEIDPLDADMQRRTDVAMAAVSQAPRRLPDALATRLRAHWAAACLPPGMADRIAPEMQAMLLSMQAGRREGLDPAYGVEAVLAAFARGQDLPRLSLETPEAQLALMTGDARLGRRLVEETLDQLDSGRGRALIRHVGAIWAESRFDELSRYAEWCDCMRDDEERTLMKRMLDDRNTGMAERIEALHAQGKRVFAAVGSLHMIGPQGVPALMRGRGFVVERVGWGP